MKNRLLYGLIYIIAFFVVTGMLIIANENFENIFAFDFSEKKHYSAEMEELEEDEELQDTFNSDKNEVKRGVEDSIIVKDSLLTIEISADTSQASTALIKIPQLSELKKEQEEKPGRPKETKQDSSYLKWKRETVKLYEAMDSKKVAKLISNLSDDIARDLIYSMKKRKAAEVLSNLSPEIAVRLTRAR